MNILNKGNQAKEKYYLRLKMKLIYQDQKKLLIKKHK